MLESADGLVCECDNYSCVDNPLYLTKDEEISWGNLNQLRLWYEKSRDFDYLIVHKTHLTKHYEIIETDGNLCLVTNEMKD